MYWGCLHRGKTTWLVQNTYSSWEAARIVASSLYSLQDLPVFPTLLSLVETKSYCGSWVQRLSLTATLDAVNFPERLGLALRALSDRLPGKLARLLPIGSTEDTRGHELLDVLGLFLYRNPLCVELWERLTGYVEAGVIRPTSFSTLEGLEADVVNAALDGSRAKPQIRL
jgi:hypothetical protein